MGCDLEDLPNDGHVLAGRGGHLAAVGAERGVLGGRRRRDPRREVWFVADDASRAREVDGDELGPSLTVFHQEGDTGVAADA